MKLSPRLLTISSQVTKGSIVADIGTDHAYIPIYLVEKGICPKVIATEIREGPFKRAKAEVQKRGYTDKIQMRIGDGLKPLKVGEVDTVIIAGMGGLNIIEILSNSREKAIKINKFILQPMVAQKELRKYLITHGYKIIDEESCLEDDKFYEIIIASQGHQDCWDDIWYELGLRLFEKRHELFEQFLDKKISTIDKIITGLERGKSVHAENKLKSLKHRRQQYLEVKKCLQKPRQ